MRLSRVLALAVFVAGSGAVLAQEKIDNPMYANWAKYKPGTTVVMKSTSKNAAVTSESTTTTKLVEVTADKVVVEFSSVSKVGGMEFPSPPIKFDYAKTVELPKGAKKEDFAKGKPEGTTKEGAETIKLAGTEFKSKWYEYAFKKDGVEGSSKMWTSDEVPGSLLKMEMKTTAPLAGTTTMELVEFKKP